jgi:hypothetical protein
MDTMVTHGEQVPVEGRGSYRRPRGHSRTARRAGRTTAEDKADARTKGANVARAPRKA